jgi:hypothetical protein
VASLLLLDLDDTLLDRGACFQGWAEAFTSRLDGTSEDVE